MAGSICPLGNWKLCSSKCAWHVDGGCAVNAIAQSLAMLKACAADEEQESKDNVGDCPQCGVGILKRTVYEEPNIVRNGPGYAVVSTCPECGFRDETHMDDLPL